MIRFIRWLLYPISLLYAAIVWLRNRLYDFGLLRSTSFPIPVVIVGNLAVGGTGKSPMTEYILRIINPLKQVTVLSRGYGRKTRGFREVEVHDEAIQTGDEPLQIKRKFPDNKVVVCEDRVKAIQEIIKTDDAVLLDDAFQHRALTPSFSILLVDYKSLQQPMLPLPTGSFRDSIQESKRADIIVITKCPEEIDPETKFNSIAKFSKYSQARIFFANIAYDAFVDVEGKSYDMGELSKTSVLLFTGIANPKPLADYLRSQTASLEQLNFGDHHQFSASDLTSIGTRFSNIPADQKIIITTEKDLQRLPQAFIATYPIVIAPIRQQIMFEEEEMFELLIKKAFQSDRSVN